MKLHRFVFSLLCMLALTCRAQTPINGTINLYAQVTAVNVALNFVTVSSSAGLSIGDRVLLIQMQGATISETDDANFGQVTNYNNAGNYEILTICDISGNDITFAELMLRGYTPGAGVQLIRIPQYTNAVLNGTLSCAPWNGSTGGVLVLEVSGTLDFANQDIDVRGRGFRGPDALLNTGNCSFVLDATYYQPFTNNAILSRKGEGIAQMIANKETGRGPQANGGGGGNNHNGGGGGGGNYGYGGAGGQRVKSSAFTCGSNIGVNSIALSPAYASNKIFMGGGGGAGNGNNAGLASEGGEDGGAIVLISANTVLGNNRSIFADGLDVTGLADSDGAGGGGGGGTVLLNVNNYTGNLNVTLTGGDGASTDNSGTSNCNGPGGGGGGGVLWVSAGSVPANISFAINGGMNGIIATTNQTNCTLGSANGAQPGQIGGTRTSLSIPESTTAYSGCVLVLPANVIQISAVEIDRKIALKWSTSFEYNNAYFSWEHSTDGIHFTEIARVDAENVLTGSAYECLHDAPAETTNYYRLYQTDLNGVRTYQGQIAVNLAPRIDQIHIVPNPALNEAQLHCVSSHPQSVELWIIDAHGKRLMDLREDLTVGENKLNLHLEALESGMYFLVLKTAHLQQSARFVKQ